MYRPHALAFPKWRCWPTVVVLLLSPSTALWHLTELSFFSLYRFKAAEQLPECFIGSYLPNSLQQQSHCICHIWWHFTCPQKPEKWTWCGSALIFITLYLKGLTFKNKEFQYQNLTESLKDESVTNVLKYSDNDENGWISFEMSSPKKKRKYQTEWGLA